MKKILIYSETMLYLKGIDLLINEGIHNIETTCANSFTRFKELVSPEKHALIILHIDFLAETNKNQVKITSLLPAQTPILILTDDTVNAGKLFPFIVDHICFLDVKNTATKIISMANNMLSMTNSNNTTT
ncbi:MAG: hypothetical protein IBJ16_10035 [Chitinophagaceae bacterium]|nr:hypothetical protein [Chitinophagaceae bacterium]